VSSVLCPNTASYCTNCSLGYRLSGNSCQKCTVIRCSECLNNVGSCTTCESGYILSSDRCNSRKILEISQK